MGIEAARAVIMVVIVVVVFVVRVAVFGEMTQLHARQRLHGHGGLAAATQHAGQEVLHVRADPVQQVGIATLRTSDGRSA
jgi:hypothetical protein